MWWPTSRLGSTHPVLNVLPLAHHSSLCPASLLHCHRPLCHSVTVLILSRRLCFPFPSSLPLMFSTCQLTDWPSLPPVLYVVQVLFLSDWGFFLLFFLIFLLSPYLPHEDSAPAEVDELSQSERAGEEREKFTGGQRGKAEEGRSQRHLEQVHQMGSRRGKICS